jgi:hypothetical protein
LEGFCFLVRVKAVISTSLTLFNVAIAICVSDANVAKYYAVRWVPSPYVPVHGPSTMAQLLSFTYNLGSSKSI